MDSKLRFSDRVDTYVKYRPGYPQELLDYLYGEAGFRPESEIADIGAGTGIFTRYLLERGSRVTAIEPNREMRESLTQRLSAFANLRVLPGSAEATELADHAVDFITSAQAFHWFDRAAARTEFRRVLRPGGLAALVWNIRPISGTPFLDAYEQLLRRYGTDYKNVNLRNVSDDELAAFFQTGTLRITAFANPLLYDFEGLRGRLLSSSYTPAQGQPNHETLMAELRELFARFEQDGRVAVPYETKLCLGQV